MKKYSWQYFQRSQNDKKKKKETCNTKEQVKHKFKPIYYLLQLNILFLYYRGPFETIQIICAVINNSRIFPKRHAKNNNVISHQKNLNVDFLIRLTPNPWSPSVSVFWCKHFRVATQDGRRRARMKGIWKVGKNKQRLLVLRLVGNAWDECGSMGEQAQRTN